MTRRRSREAETEDINPRRLKRGAVERIHVSPWAIGHDEIAPGVVGGVHLGPRIIDETHLHTTLLGSMRSGETITVEATFDVPVGGAEIEWDTIVTQAGFSAIDVPPVTALTVTSGQCYYDLAEIELSWSDWRRFATVEARVNGTAVQTWTGQRGAETAPFTVPLSVLSASDEITLFVDHGDAAPHTVTARATLQLVDQVASSASWQLVETIWIDSRTHSTSGTAVSSSVALDAGVTHKLTVTGNVGLQTDAGMDLGAPDTTMFPSEGFTADEFAMVDADTVYAWSSEFSSPTLPDHSTRLQFNLGSGFAHIEPADGAQTAPTADHSYTFAVTGEGSPLSAFLSDGGNTIDNNGQLKIDIYRAVSE